MPGFQGVFVSGMQGTGTNSPEALALAATTLGFAGDRHMPKPIRLSMGLWSMMLAMGAPRSGLSSEGSTVRGQVVAPKVQTHKAPLNTKGDIAASSLLAGDVELHMTVDSIYQVIMKK